MNKIVMPLVATLAITATSFSFAKEATDKIKAGIKSLSPAAKVKSMENTPIKGISEVVIDTGRGGEVYYMSNDGKYLLNGNLIDTTSREDLTENKKSGIRKDILKKFGKKERIDFFPDDMKQHITVFTDIDCGYCRKLHNQIDDYNKLGIGISYLFFPRSGLNTPSYDKAVSVWCADNQKEALTNAKSGINLDKKTCDNPVKDQYQAGLAVGVTGTPAMVTDSGKLMPGYLPPAQLQQRIKMLEAQK